MYLAHIEFKMKIEFFSLELETLKQEYIKEVERLKTSLLNGTAWEDVQEMRRKVTQLEAALYKKIRSSNPAESPKRNSNDNIPT